jgi:hypothetical protein
MLPGFTEQTKPLTEMEQQLLPVIVRGLAKKIGSDNAVTNKTICEGLHKTYDVVISEARIRKIINHIRMNNLVPGLVANSCGYYVSKNPKEVMEYIESLEGRKNAIEGIAMQFKKYLHEITNVEQNSFNYK